MTRTQAVGAARNPVDARDRVSSHTFCECVGECLAHAGFKCEERALWRIRPKDPIHVAWHAVPIPAVVLLCDGCAQDDSNHLLHLQPAEQLT